MRDYAQYTATPMKTKNKNLGSNSNSSQHQVTPSPSSSSAASFPNYRLPAAKSQVAVLNRAHQQYQQELQQQQQQQQRKQARDATSTPSTAVMSNEQQSPLSQDSSEGQHQQQHNSGTTNTTDKGQHHHHHHQQQQQMMMSPYQQQLSPRKSQIPSPRKSQIPSPKSRSPQAAPTGSPLPSSNKSPHPSSKSPHAHSPNGQYNNNNSRTGAAATAAGASALAPEDALHLKRDGPEATIVSLRQALEEAKERDAADKSNLAKSDATILELRSSVRQLKRQLEKLDGDARQKHQELVAAKQQLQVLKQNKRSSSAAHPLHDSDNASANASANSASVQEQHAIAKDERIGELQVQLDRAHGQLLTADMVRKELEDTLEAEQYTWELRVQDQERTIVELQQEIGVLAEDLEQCRHQWKEADEEWAKKVADLEADLANYKGEHGDIHHNYDGINNNNNNNSSNDHREVEELHEKMRQLEEERNELQTCLDEALQELEAVDAELGNHTPAEVQQLRQENQRLQEVVEKQRTLQQQQQLQQGDQDFDTLEGLQHLYRWLLERSDGEEKKSDNMPQTSPELLDAIHQVLESMPNWDRPKNNNITNDSSELATTVAELETQLSVYRGDLQAREESSAELRASLKEAVALIKPLQDAVDKADQQKADLQQEVDRLRSDHDLETNELQEELQSTERKLMLKKQECERLQQDMHHLKTELEETRELAQARQAMHGLSPSAAAAGAAAQSTQLSTQPPQQELTSLSKARADLKAKREQENTLRNLLRDAQNRFHSLNQQNQSVEAMNQQLQGRLKETEEQRSRSAGSMEGLEVDIVSVTQQNQQELEQQIAKLKKIVEDKESELKHLRENSQQSSEDLKQKVQELEENLSQSQEELKKKQQSEKVLNKSLKEALGLLKPLQSHLEEAEEENKDLSKEIRTLRRKLNAMEIQGMGAVVASPSSQSNADSKSPHGVNTPDSQYARSNEEILREKQELEETVRQLEQENSQLHDALDEMSNMHNSNSVGGKALTPQGHGHLNTPNTNITNKAEARYKEEIVELKSRYEVTQSRLEDAYVENHTLVEALKEKEESEKDAIEGMRILREKLQRTEMDLENAKFIATSALVKVEQAKSRDQNVSINSAFETAESHTVHSLEEKAIELDLLAAAGIHQALPSANTGWSPSNSNGNHYHRQQQQRESFLPGGSHQSHNHDHDNTWAGKRSRLADF